MSSRAILLPGRDSTVRHSAGVVFGFIVGLSASRPAPVGSVHLQVWRPRHADAYELVCQRSVSVPDNVSRPAHQVAATIRIPLLVIFISPRVVYTRPFNGPSSGTTRVSRYQKGKTNLDFTEARGSEWQWHQLGHMQVCTSLQTDSQHPTTQFFTGRVPFLSPNQQRQSTEGKTSDIPHNNIK